MTNDEAIKKIEELCEYKGYNYTVITDKDVEALHKANEVLRNERPKGEWVRITKTNVIPVEYMCSVCGRKIFDNYEHQIPQSEFYPYCHCGADMRKEQKNER